MILYSETTKRKGTGVIRTTLHPILRERNRVFYEKCNAQKERKRAQFLEDPVALGDPAVRTHRYDFLTQKYPLPICRLPLAPNCLVHFQSSSTSSSGGYASTQHSLVCLGTCLQPHKPGTAGAFSMKSCFKSCFKHAFTIPRLLCWCVCIYLCAWISLLLLSNLYCHL